MAGRKRTKRYGLEGIVDNGGFLHLKILLVVQNFNTALKKAVLAISFS